jgi:hypothetical protein
MSSDAACEGPAAVQEENFYNRARPDYDLGAAYPGFGVAPIALGYLPFLGRPLSTESTTWSGGFAAKRDNEFKSQVCNKQLRSQAKLRRHPKKPE